MPEPTPEPTPLPTPEPVKPPAVGDPAPSPDLTDQDGAPLTLRPSAFTVLFFYPRALTPGCTQEAQDFKECFDDFALLGADIIGVSRDPVKRIKSFHEKHDLPFSLATTEQGAERFGVWVEKKNYGRTYYGIQRATFVVTPDGLIAAVWPKVSVKGHARAVLDALRGLS